MLFRNRDRARAEAEREAHFEQERLSNAIVEALHRNLQAVEAERAEAVDKLAASEKRNGRLAEIVRQYREAAEG